MNTTSSKSTDHKVKKDIRKLERGSESRFRKQIQSMPDDDGYDGEERILENASGNHDLVKRIGNKWIKLSGTLNGLEINKVNGVPHFEIIIEGKKYRLALEENR